MSTTTRYGKGAINSATNRIANATSGSRHQTIYNESRSLARLQAGGEIESVVEIKNQLVAAARGTGLTDGEIYKQIRNGIRDGEVEPRTCPNTLYQPSMKSDKVCAITQWFDGLDQVGMKPVQLKLAKALAERAIMCDSHVFEGSMRQIAIYSGVSLMTVSRNASKIPGLTYVPGCRLTGKPTVWTIAITESEEATGSSRGSTTGLASLSLSQPRLQAESIMDANHEMWADRDYAWKIFMFLDANSDMQYRNVDLCRLTGHYRQAVSKALRYLESFGLIEKVDGTYWRRSQNNDIDPELVTGNRVERRHEKYKVEQTTHKMYVKVQKVLRQLAHQARQQGKEPRLKAVRNHEGWTLADLTQGKIIFSGATGEFNAAGIY